MRQHAFWFPVEVQDIVAFIMLYSTRFSTRTQVQPELIAQDLIAATAVRTCLMWIFLSEGIVFKMTK